MWSCLSQCSPHRLLGLGTRGTPRSSPGGSAREPRLGPNHTAGHLAPALFSAQRADPWGPEPQPPPCACPPLFQPGDRAARWAGAGKVTFLFARGCSAERGAPLHSVCRDKPGPLKNRHLPLSSTRAPRAARGAPRAPPPHGAPPQGRGTRARARRSSRESPRPRTKESGPGREQRPAPRWVRTHASLRTRSAHRAGPVPTCRCLSAGPRGGEPCRAAPGAWGDRGDSAGAAPLPAPSPSSPRRARGVWYSAPEEAAAGPAPVSHRKPAPGPPHRRKCAMAHPHTGPERRRTAGSGPRHSTAPRGRGTEH